LITVASAVDTGNVMSMFQSDSQIASYIVGLKTAPLDTTNVTPNNRPAYVYQTLSRWAELTQGSLQAKLDDLEIEYTSYWVSNIIVVNSNMSVAQLIAARDDVVRLEPNKEFRVNLEVPESIESDSSAAVIEWNVQWVKADRVWPQGFKGEGKVVANADTGIAWKHPALLHRYRGTQSGSTDHNYNWWDAIHGGSNNPRCGHNSQEPCDDNGHGTHTTGTAVGYAESTETHIGVAPGATWIGCRNMNLGLGTPQTYIECLQFFIAPTDLNGENPKPDLAPHVIGNSYGCPPSEGCAVNAMASAVTAVIKAGIFMSVSAGNDGPGCSTVRDPPAVYEDSFSVGATGLRTHTIASYSSRGPVSAGGSNILKPNIAAPGSSVRSAYPPSGYATLSGTSMASPAVTGGIALLWQAKQEYDRNPIATYKWLENTAIPAPSKSCPSSASAVPDVPNNVYGYGELDLEAACLRQA